jgi:transcriptional regulator with XRE-family HTH domain
MTTWIKRRKKSGMSQFLCAQSSGVSRMRLSLAETGQVKLTPDEESAVYRALNGFISERALEIRQLLLEQELKHAAPGGGGVDS